MKRLMKGAIFLIYMFVFCFFIGEVSVRALYPHFYNYNMEMWRCASQHKCQLPSTKLPFYLVPDKEENYYGISIKTNSLGFRDYEYSVAKPAGKKRIIFLGDSHTFGWGVPFEKICSKRLERMLNEKRNRYEVINMGVGNYNSVMEVELFKLKGLMLEPDMVVLMYFINDVEPTPKRKSNIGYFIKRHSYFFAFLFDRYVNLKVHFDKTFKWEKYHSDLYSEGNSINLDLARESIKELINLCKERNIKILVVNIPDLHLFKEYPFSYATRYVQGLAGGADVPFLDLLPAFASYDPQSLWISPEDPHMNSKAHSIAAEQIYQKISNNKELEALLTY